MDFYFDYYDRALTNFFQTEADKKIRAENAQFVRDNKLVLNEVDATLATDTDNLLAGSEELRNSNPLKQNLGGIVDFINNYKWVVAGAGIILATIYLKK